MENFRIQMIGLKLSRIHRERQPVAPFAEQSKTPAEPAVEIKAK